MSPGPTVVLITSAGPYLGGPLTWAPLRAAAPEISFFEIDPLDFAEVDSLAESGHRIIAEALVGANAIVAHFTVAREAIEAVAAIDPNLPILLLSPALIGRGTVLLRVLRELVARPPLAWALIAFARAKWRRLCRDRAYVKAQLALFVGERALSDALVDEAQARIATARTERVVERTAEFLAYSLAPVDSKCDAAVRNRTILVGVGRLGDAIAKRMPAIVLETATGAPMLEDPEAVARALRELLVVRA